jgi:hypothetical protein
VDQVSLPPAAPAGLAAAAVSSSQVNLSWSDRSGDEVGFRIERKIGTGGTYAQVATVGADVTDYPDTGLAASTTYVYRVRAYNSSGESAWSNEASATTPAAPAGQAVTGFALINADTDQPVAGYDPLLSGAVLDLSALPTRNLNVRANTSPAAVGSVRFGYDGNANFRTENAGPYALAGDTGGNYYAWTPASGTHSLTATPWSGSGATGTMGTPLTITFSVLGGAAKELWSIEEGAEEEVAGEEPPAAVMVAEDGGGGDFSCGLLGIEFLLPLVLLRIPRRRPS